MAVLSGCHAKHWINFLCAYRVLMRVRCGADKTRTVLSQHNKHAGLLLVLQEHSILMFHNLTTVYPRTMILFLEHFIDQ
jgi:hypothetical protein